MYLHPYRQCCCITSKHLICILFLLYKQSDCQAGWMLNNDARGWLVILCLFQSSMQSLQYCAGSRSASTRRFFGLYSLLQVYPLVQQFLGFSARHRSSAASGLPQRCCCSLKHAIPFFLSLQPDSCWLENEQRCSRAGWSYLACFNNRYIRNSGGLVQASTITLDLRMAYKFTRWQIINFCGSNLSFSALPLPPTLHLQLEALNRMFVGFTPVWV